MRILVASHTYIVKINREKLKILADLEPNIEVTVVVPRRWQPGGVQNQLIETHPQGENSFKIVPISNFSQNRQGLLTFGPELVGLLRQFRPHIIQVEQGAKALGYAQLITLNKLLNLKAKNLFFTWWNLPYQLKWPISWLEAYNLKNTDGIIAGNLDGAKILQQRGYKGPIEVMPQLGIDEEVFRYTGKNSNLLRLLKIQPTDFVVGFVGRFVEEKGLLTLGKALAGLKGYAWKWLLVGRGELRSRLSDLATEWGIRDRLIWVEGAPHHEVSRYINLMDVLVLPSQTSYKFKTLTSVGWKEQFGHVLIEAMACQVPVIGSDCGEIPHVIGKAGLIFPEGDIEALKNSILQLIEKPALTIELKQLGYERAMVHYTNQALAKELLRFYQKLLDS